MALTVIDSEGRTLPLRRPIPSSPNPVHRKEPPPNSTGNDKRGLIRVAGPVMEFDLIAGGAVSPTWALLLITAHEEAIRHPGFATISWAGNG
eukprot:scaffold2045_cov404-Prasinococcus_capsulatus_cf.AAC.60